MTDLCLQSRRCLLPTPDGGLEWVHARIDVDASTITRVHRIDGDSAPATRPGTEVIDFGEHLLVPAFVNAHTHVALQAYRGLVRESDLTGNMIEDLFFRVESHLEEGDARAFARIGALECLLNGIGTVFDHYYFGSAVAEGMRDVGLAGVVAPTLQDVAGPGKDRSQRELEMTEELCASSWAEAGIVAAVGPHATDTVSSKLWREALDLAESKQIPLHAHLAQTADEMRRCLERHGVSPVKWLEREGLLHRPVSQLLVHALMLDDDDLDALDPSIHRLGSCPFSQLQFGFPARVDRWTARRIPWFVGTDCGPSNDSMNVQKELRMLAGQATYRASYSAEHAMLERGVDLDRIEALELVRTTAVANIIDPTTLLKTVTSGPGSWHPSLQTGRIEVGCRADLAVYDPDHPAMWPAGASSQAALRALAFADTSAALHSLLVGGRWIGQLGDVRALLREPEVAEMFEEAETRRRALLDRAKLTAPDAWS